MPSAGSAHVCAETISGAGLHRDGLRHAGRDFGQLDRPLTFVGDIRQGRAEYAVGQPQGRQDEFLSALREDRAPWPNAAVSANWTCVGICARESATRGGEIVRLPDFTLAT